MKKIKLLVKIIYYDLKSLIIRGRALPVCWDKCGNDRNFGDQISRYLIEKLTSKKITYVSPGSFRTHYLLTGSIIEFANRNSIIWGSGAISNDVRINKVKKICALRGVYTKKLLEDQFGNISEIYGDPGELIPYVYIPKKIIVKDILLIPHYTEYQDVYNYLDCNRDLKEKIELINPLDSIENISDAIASSRLVFSSSLHGIIVSDAYQIHCIPIKILGSINGKEKNNIGDFKYKDYFSTIGCEQRVIHEINMNELGCITRVSKCGDPVTKNELRIRNFINSCPFKLNIG